MYELEVTTLNGKQVQTMPWLAPEGCPWDKTKHERVVRTLDTPTRSGKRAEVLVVRKSKLKTVRVRVA